MKILHVISSLDPIHGGPSVAVVQLCNAQASSSENNISLLSGYVGSKEKARQKEIIAVLSKDVNLLLLSCLSQYRVPLNIFSYFAVLKSTDVIHVHGIYRGFVTIASLFGMLFNKKVIVRPHGSLDPYLRRTYKKLYPFKNIIKFISEICLERPILSNVSALHFTARREKQLASWFHHNSKTFVIPNGVEKPMLVSDRHYIHRLLNLDKETRIILFIGRLHYKKGIDLLIAAFSLIFPKNFNLHLVIAGPNNDGLLDSLKAQANALQIPSNQISFLDRVPRELIGPYYYSASVFALTSHSENFGITVVEALSYGCPVVLSKSINISQFLDKHKLAILTDLDASSIANSLLVALNDNRHRDCVRRFGPSFVNDTYSWNAIATLHLSNYAHL